MSRIPMALCTATASTMSSRNSRHLSSTMAPTRSCLAPMPSQPPVAPNPAVASTCQCLHDASPLSSGLGHPPKMVVSRFDYHVLGPCINMLQCTEPLCVGTRCLCLRQYPANTMQAAHAVALILANVYTTSQPIPLSILVLCPQRCGLCGLTQ